MPQSNIGLIGKVFGDNIVMFQSNVEAALKYLLLNIFHRFQLQLQQIHTRHGTIVRAVASHRAEMLVKINVHLLCLMSDLHLK